MVWLLPRGGRPAAGGGGVPTAPASITSPVVGTELSAVWALQGTGATGPRGAYTNGTWNTTYAEAAVGSGVFGVAPNDPYLRDLGFIYNNIGALVIPLHSSPGYGPDVNIANYNFNGAGGRAPILTIWGDANIVFTDCKDPAYDSSRDYNFNAVTADTHTVQFTYCELNQTTWSLQCPTTLEFGPYNYVHGQLQNLGTAGGDGTLIRTSVFFHHNYVTGGGVSPPGSGAHVEAWQHIYHADQGGWGQYVYVEDNMWDFSKEFNWLNDEGWTAIFSEGGDTVIRVRRNVFKGIDISRELHGHGTLGGMGPILTYDALTLGAGVDFTDNAMSCSPDSPGGYCKGDGGAGRPTMTGNRTFRDADSAAVSAVGPADNLALTSASVGVG